MARLARQLSQFGSVEEVKEFSDINRIQNDDRNDSFIEALDLEN